MEREIIKQKAGVKIYSCLFNYIVIVGCLPPDKFLCGNSAIFKCYFYQLKKGFKEVFGTTVFGYLKDVRMMEAKKMLLKNDLPIADIALLCGYKFVQNFTKAFKKEFGTTPDKFRS